MDIITVIWYLSTFLALAAFFFLMACSDRKCLNRSSRTIRHNNEQITLQAPPTPAPSYSEFAPPSYETVMKQKSKYEKEEIKNNIYVIPINQNHHQILNTSNNNNNKNILSKISSSITSRSKILSETNVNTPISSSSSSSIILSSTNSTTITTTTVTTGLPSIISTTTTTTTTPTTTTTIPTINYQITNEIHKYPG